jgi:uncharacterized protein (TIGR02453 family)
MEQKSARDFAGFPPAALQFLVDLRDNNSRDWFTANRAVFDSELMVPARALCAELQPFLHALTGEPHSAKIWRMHRDLRFAKDKTPYNTHLHISFMPDQAPTGSPGWYLGLDTLGISLGCGSFAFGATQLEAFRRAALAKDGAAVASTMQKLAASGVRFPEPELKQVPRGYDRAHARADLLRRKGLTAWIDTADRAIASRSDFADFCRASFKRLKPAHDICRL